MNYIIFGGKLSQDDVRRGACRNLKAGDVRSRPLFQHPETQVDFWKRILYLKQPSSWILMKKA